MLARSTILPASRLIPRSSALQYAIVSTGARRATSTAAKNRPLSPHLEIYKFPFNAITSVAFRATGILLTTGAVGTGIASIACEKPISYYINALKASPFLLFAVKLSVAAPLTFHYIGGIRHLTWDKVIGHTPETVRKTGLFLVGASAAISVIAAASSTD